MHCRSNAKYRLRLNFQISACLPPSLYIKSIMCDTVSRTYAPKVSRMLAKPLGRILFSYIRQKVECLFLTIRQLWPTLGCKLDAVSTIGLPHRASSPRHGANSMVESHPLCFFLVYKNQEHPPKTTSRSFTCKANARVGVDCLPMDCSWLAIITTKRYLPQQRYMHHIACLSIWPCNL